MRYPVVLAVLMLVVGFVAGVSISPVLFTRTLTMTTTVYSTITLAERIRIVVLVDNNPYGQGLVEAWGLSVYVEADGVRLLFDAGPDPAVLEANAERLGIDLAKIDFIVISHVHGDHTGGLKLLASIKPGMVVYVPPDESLISYVKSLGLKPIQVNSTIEVSKGIYAVKPLYGPPVEEALAFKTSRGLVVLVGCSHPGVVNIVRQAVEDVGTKPYIVLGGFHMAGAALQEVQKVTWMLVGMGVEKICPIHCSGDTIRDYLANYYKDNYEDGGVGLEIIIQG
jgi:7,8-dihydropterin-6-yl-methyl-4-(beta-D-ribofuranosyl)aminobenzene 5'-phosphate synthase